MRERHSYEEGALYVCVTSDPPVSSLGVSPLIKFSLPLSLPTTTIACKEIHSESWPLLRPHYHKINKPQIPNMARGRR